VTELDSIRIIVHRVQGRNFLLSSYFIIFSLFICRSDQMSRQHDSAAPSQHDSATTSHHSQRHLGSVIASMTRQWHHATTNVASITLLLAWLRDLACTFLTSNLTQRFTADQAMGLKEYHSNRQLDSGTLLPTSPTSTRGEHVVTNNIMGHFVETDMSYS
jgi:hypothetical protein